MNIVNWHPYPEEKPLPPKDDSGDLYLVTVSKKINPGFKVDIDLWLGRGFSNWRHYSDEHIVAWAYMPEPYPEIEND